MKSPTDIWNEILRDLRSKNSDYSSDEFELFSYILPKAVHRLYAIAYEKGKSEGQTKDE